MATILIHPDTASATRATAERLLATIRADPHAVLGLATGGTMEPVYAQLIARAVEAQVSFAGLHTFNLDEYIGLAGDHPQSYRTTMDRLLFEHVDIPRDRTHLPRGDAENPGARRATTRRRSKRRGDRPAIAGAGRQWACRFQRAVLLAGLADPDQAAGALDDRSQCALLRAG